MKRKKGKHRKRTNKNIPAKGVLRSHADRLWSLAVRDDWGWRCAVCGVSKCEAHHVIPRQHEATRYDLRNGIALSATYHQFDADISPHQNAAGWLAWLCENEPELHQWYIETTANGKHKTFDGKTNVAYFCDLIRGFREYVSEEDYERVVGVKFSRWLDSEVE